MSSSSEQQHDVRCSPSGLCGVCVDAVLDALALSDPFAAELLPESAARVAAVHAAAAARVAAREAAAVAGARAAIAPVPGCKFCAPFLACDVHLDDAAADADAGVGA